jgi:hypothetical protein
MRPSVQDKMKSTVFGKSVEQHIIQISFPDGISPARSLLLAFKTLGNMIFALYGLDSRASKAIRGRSLAALYAEVVILEIMAGIVDEKGVYKGQSLQTRTSQGG